MQRQYFSKRDILRLSAAMPFCFLPIAKLSAQNANVLGVPIPRQLLDFIPAKPLNVARTVEKVIRLEKEADLRKLPQSILSRGKGQLLLPDEGAYQALLPRLVALIDRSELRELGLAEQAGALLAELHQSEHEIPEALQTGLWQGDSLIPQGTDDYLRIDGNSGGQVIPGINVGADIVVPKGAPDPLPPVADEVDLPLSASRKFESLRSEYGRLYQTAKVRAANAGTVDWHLSMIRNAKPRYAAVGEAVGVPWYFIGVIHGLEASFNFRAHLHNGDHPLSARTRQVPAGRPTKWLPPSDWESSARDALRLLGFTGQSDWTLERTLYRLEAYNGFGYRGYGVATPYLWSFSNHYERGKFVSDRKWSATAKSQQCGAAMMLKGLADAGDFRWPES